MTTHLPCDRNSIDTNDGEGEYSSANAAVIAIDKDKHCNYIVRWAIDNLAVKASRFVFVHVRVTNHENQLPCGANGTEKDLQELFVAIRGYCVRRRVKTEEVVLFDTDVSKALLEYINKKSIMSIVVGASTKKVAFGRKSKSGDVATGLIKSAPDFCSVYAISKGKVMSMRKGCPSPNTTVPANLTSPSPLVHLPRFVDEHSESDDVIRVQHVKAVLRNGGEKINNDSTTEGQQQDGVKTSISDLPVDYNNTSSISRNSSRHNSLSEESDFSGSLAFRPSDFSDQDVVSSTFSESNNSSLAASTSQSVAQPDLEAEMRKLKLELQQTMTLYSTACKEALSAKKKAEELQILKLEEARKFKEAKLAGEAALAIAEMEKAKCKAAIKAAEKAQRLAQMELQKRKNAEMKAKREAEENKRALNALVSNEVHYRKYTFEEIEEATEKFNDDLKIGEGGYGPVYKGKLDHTQVAIKVLRPDAVQGERQFQQEVDILSTIRHPNMVLLLGACPQQGCLIYEYMENGSLEDRLIRRGNTPPLSWRKRFEIAAEISTALLFLHQTKPEPLVHRDLKPANILLDRNFVSKIGDVGLARLVPPSVANNVTQYHLTSAAGTFCYIDPEYQQTGKLTTRSDIYSLGIMLLQIITARPPMGLAHLLLKAIAKGRFSEVLDQSVLDWPVEEAERFAKLALKCAELRKKDRPSLGSVILPELNRLKNLGFDNDPRRSVEYHVRDSRRSAYSHGSRRHSPLPHPSSSTSLANGCHLQARTSNTSQVMENKNINDELEK